VVEEVVVTTELLLLLVVLVVVMDPVLEGTEMQHNPQLLNLELRQIMDIVEVDLPLPEQFPQQVVVDLVR
tara:strand:+ start:26 stop:235 length:210 start_codon:yes stop_codon:yes gene_type:complete